MFFEKSVILSAKVKVTNQVTLSHLILSVGSLTPHPQPLPLYSAPPRHLWALFLKVATHALWKVDSWPSVAENRKTKLSI